MTAWLSEPRASRGPAGPMPSARSRSVVGHMQIVVSRSSSRSLSVRWVAWTAQLSGPSAPWPCRSSVGVQPWTARQASFSARCSERWKCSGLPGAHSTTVGIWSAGTARTEWIAAPMRACGASSSPSTRCGPARGVAVAEAPLGAGRRLPEAAGDVARVEQRDPDPRLAGRRDQRLAERVGAVVQVVELAHARDPGQRHLAVDGSGQRVVAVGGELRRDRVHVLAPRPERPAGAVRAPAQRAVERVRVRVAQARQRHPAQPLGVPARHAGVDLGDAPVRDDDAHVGDDAVAAEPGEIGVIAGHSAIGTRMSRSAATCSARS